MIDDLDWTYRDPMLEFAVPWPEPGVARPLGRCAVLGCEKLRHDDGRYIRRWCEDHARLYDREVAAAGPGKLLSLL